LATSSTIDEALTDPTQQKVDMVTNAINDVVSKTDAKGFEMSELKNGAVSSYYAEGNLPSQQRLLPSLVYWPGTLRTTERYFIR
jgi:hypothetical protein